MTIRKRKTCPIHIGQVFRFRFDLKKVCVLRMFSIYVSFLTIHSSAAVYYLSCDI